MSVIKSTSVIILAAGQGTRLNEGRPSKIPKVMHEICGRPMLAYTLDTLKQIGFKDMVIVVGYKAELIKKYFGHDYKYAIQVPQNGTGHAVRCAQSLVNPNSENILVIQGDDSAFYQPATLVNLVSTRVREQAKISLLTVNNPDPAELGRIIRDKNGQVIAIKEKEVLTNEEKRITETNAATYCFAADWLWSHLEKLKPSATGQGEIILPDLIKIAIDQGEKVSAYMIDDYSEWVGVNNPEQLARANKLMTERLKK